METLIIFALFIGVMWLLLIAPQRRKQKQHAQMLEALQRGDDVITIGGIHGRVRALTDSYVDLEVTDDDDIVLRFQRSSIAKRVTEDQPTEATGS